MDKLVVHYETCRGVIEIIKCDVVDYSGDKFLICKDQDRNTISVKALIPYSQIKEILRERGN